MSLNIRRIIIWRVKGLRRRTCFQQHWFHIALTIYMESHRVEAKVAIPWEWRYLVLRPGFCWLPLEGPLASYLYTLCPTVSARVKMGLGLTTSWDSYKGQIENDLENCNALCKCYLHHCCFDFLSGALRGRTVQVDPFTDEGMKLRGRDLMTCPRLHSHAASILLRLRKIRRGLAYDHKGFLFLWNPLL